LPPGGTLPSDRLIGMESFGLPGRDVLRFRFGNPSLEPAGVPTGQITVAAPPFTEAASGRSIALDGTDSLEVVFKGMSIMNDVGQPVFEGDREIRGDDSTRSMRHVVMFDESEGQIGWYVGYDRPACATLTREGNDVVLALEFGTGS